MRERVERAARLIAFTGIGLLSVIAVFAGPPQAAFTPTMATDRAGSLSVRLDAASSFDAEGNVVVYQWVFGDGTTGSGQVVVHTYPSPGEYSVTLFVADDQGETTRIVEEIAVPISSVEAASPSDPRLPAANRTDTAVVLPTGISVGERAPDFALDVLGGGRFVLSDVRGSVVILDFWSSGCGGCQATMPGFVAMLQQLASSSVLAVGVPLDRDEASVERYTARYGFEGLTLWESASANRSVMSRYGITSVPTTLVIDALGVIRFRGYRSDLTLSMVQGIALAGDRTAIRTGARDEHPAHDLRSEGG